MTNRTFARNAACAFICASVVMLAGCNKAPHPQAANPAASSTSPAPAPAGTSANAQQPAPYTPPTANQLYQLVAPIALFPDKLVAQVLAGSTYPGQITAADNMLQQHPKLTGTLLADAVNPEPWDPSVKGLTQFPSVLDQMAQNIQWTTSLGTAYVNDPADVMNAIQVMRKRAQSNGSLHSSSQMQVVTQATGSTVSDQIVEDGNAPPVYSGPAVVPPPAQTIVIQPANPDTVYVPQYNPETVYGAPIAAYPGYTYVQPVGYGIGRVVAAGAIGFGVGVVVGALLDHHGGGPSWGWHSWGMHWGGHWGGSYGGYGGGWQRAAVVHNNSVYVSHSATVVNRYVTNNNSRTFNSNSNRTFNNNTNNHMAGNSVTNGRAAAATQRPAAQAMTTPHFGTPVRGAEPARFEQAHAAAQSAAHSTANEASHETAHSMQQSRPGTAAQSAAHSTANEASHEAAHSMQQSQHEAASAHEMPRTGSVHDAASHSAERATQRAGEQRQRAGERPDEHSRAQGMERGSERHAPHSEARHEPQRHAAHRAPARRHDEKRR